MCNEQTERDNDRHQTQRGQSQTGIGRREFNQSAAVLALAAMIPASATAAEVAEHHLLVPTPDGECDSYLVHPVSGVHPAVVMWPDVMGIRSAFRLMTKRLAGEGYTVLVVNPYYRTHHGEIIAAGEGYQDAAVRERIAPHRATLSASTAITDGSACVEFLRDHEAVDSGRAMATCGYCMTGSYALRLAAALPGQIAAGASFHGGGLVTDEPDSPHRLLDDISANLLIAIADNDDQAEPDAKTLLSLASNAADVDAEIEVYPGALHGWCVLDSRAYNEAMAERAWGRLLALLERSL